MTDDGAAEPGATLPVDVADDARFDLLAAPLAGPAPATHVGTHVGVADPEPVDEPPAEAAESSGVEPADLEPADLESPDLEQPVRVRSSDQDTLVLQAAVAEVGPTNDEDAAPEPDARAADPATGPLVPDGLPAPSVPRHRRQPWALLVLSILLALTLGLATYLLLTTRAYERRSAEWESAARTTGSDLTQVRADLEATTSDLAATRDQLATAQARIIELADEKAKLGDDRAIQRQLVDYQQRISAAAGNVATALNTCIDGQYKLIGYLENPSAYNQTDLARFRTDVQTVCGAAKDANAALQRELKK